MSEEISREEALLSLRDGEGLSFSRRFQIRAIELGRLGSFGALKTRKSTLQKSFGFLASQLDNPTEIITVFGEQGSGKRRLVKEFLHVQNFYNRLEGHRSHGQLKIFLPEFLRSGFTKNFLTPNSIELDILLLENVDELSAHLQKELEEFIEKRGQLSSQGVKLPRLMFTTQRALSLMVVQEKFSRSLFVKLTSATVFMPSLNERPEDMIDLISDLVFELSSKKPAAIPVWLVNLFQSDLWAGNISELKSVLREMLKKEENPDCWSRADLPAKFNLESSDFELASGIPDITNVMKEKNKLKQILLQCGGNRQKAAMRLGLSQAELLRKLLSHGVR